MAKEDKNIVLEHHYISRELTEEDMENFYEEEKPKSPTHIMIRGFICTALCFYFNFRIFLNPGSIKLHSDSENILMRMFVSFYMFIFSHPVVLPAACIIITGLDLISSLTLRSTKEMRERLTPEVLLHWFEIDSRKKNVFCEAVRADGFIVQNGPIICDDDYLDILAAFLTDTVKNYPNSLSFITAIMNYIRSGEKKDLAKGIIYTEVIFDQLKLGNEDILYPDTPSLSNYIFYEHDTFNVTKEIKKKIG